MIFCTVTNKQYAVGSMKSHFLFVSSWPISCTERQNYCELRKSSWKLKMVLKD